MPAAAFVVVWSSGYIAGPLGVEAVEPITLLALRFVVATLLLGAWARWRRGPMRLPRGVLVRLGAVGLMMNGLQFVFMYLAFDVGLGATLGALMHSLSPCSPSCSPGCCCASGSPACRSSAWWWASPAS